jgi:DNA polymerase III alpha subunit
VVISNSQFVFLRVHSWYSIESGVPKVSELVEKAASLGYRALALTDYATLAGIPEFVRQCRLHRIHPVIGVELDVASTATPAAWQVVFLAENNRGYTNLVRFVSQAYRDSLEGFLGGDGGGPRLLLEHINGDTEGVIALVDLVQRNGRDELKLDPSAGGDILPGLISLFGADHVFLSISRPPDQQFVENAARKWNLGVVVTPPIYYLYPEDLLVYDFLQGRECPRTIDLHTLDDTHCLCSPDRIAARFAGNVGGLVATVRLADRCKALVDGFSAHFPIMPVEYGTTADSSLRSLVTEKVESVFPEVHSRIRERLECELRTFSPEIAERLLLFHALVEYCRSRKVTLGVGSGEWITSLVAYVLGLSQIDPLRFKLNFAGFSGISGSSDNNVFVLEMPPTAASVIVDFFREKFGDGHCGRVGKYVNVQRMILARQVLHWCHFESLPSLDQLTTTHDALRPFSSFVKVAGGTLNMPSVGVADFLMSRLLGRPGEFVVSDNELAVANEQLANLVPLLNLENQPVTQIDADGLSLFGIGRFQLSCPPLLSILDAAVRWVRDKESQFDVARIPLDDPRTYELLRRGYSLGIEPFHSVRMRMRLRKESPRNFQELLKLRSDDATATGEGRDIRHFLPECLLAYRAAFVKAHFPACFFAAALSHFAVAKQFKKIPALVREAVDMGVKFLPPDINHSMYRFTVERTGVRMGLCVVQGVGERVFQEIEAARNTGEFLDLIDLRRRTEKRILNSRVLNNLIRAGALDSMEQDRTEMLARLDQLGGQLETGPDDLFGTHLDVPGDGIQQLSLRDRMYQEIAVTGLPFTAYPLRIYGDVIKRCRAKRMTDIMHRRPGQDITCVGYINHVDDEPTRYGNQDLILVDVDTYPVFVPVKVHEAYAAAFQSPDPVLIQATLEQHEDDFVARAYALFPLSTVEEIAKVVEEIHIDLTHETSHTLRLLLRALWRYRGGRTRVRLIEPPRGLFGSPTAWLCELRRVYFCPPLYFTLKKILTENQIELLGRDAESYDELMRLLSPFHYGKQKNSSQKLPAVEV